MAHWIYVKPTKTVGSISGYDTYGYTTITGFPLYTSDQAYILTEENPANRIAIRYGRTNTYNIIYDYWGGIQVSCNGTYTIFDGEVDDAMTNTTGHNIQILPNKLFRVSNSTSIDAYCTTYEDVEIYGKYRVRDLGTPFMQGCLIPVPFLLNGSLYEGIGNYNSSTFKYTNSSYSESSAMYSFINDATYMEPKAIARKSDYSNTLVLYSIKAGDILDFGTLHHRVPSVLKNWLETNCDDVTDASEPMSVSIISPNGIHLLTEGTYCNWDIKALPKLQTKTVTPSTISQEVVADSGNAGLEKVIVNPIPKELGMPEEYDGSLVTEITFTIDGTEYEAEDGMNWKDWVADTSYNKNGSVIIAAIGTLHKEGSDEIRTSQNDVVFAEDLIISGESYVFGSIAPEITFTIEGAEFKATEGMSWGEWVDNRFYNNGRFIPLDNNVHDQSCWENVRTHDDVPVTPTNTIVDGAEYYSGQGGGSND